MLGVLLGIYVGSYFLCVFEVRFGFTRGDRLYAAPAYRYVPTALSSTALWVYRPIHLVDEQCLRPAKWRAQPAKDGLGSPVWPRRVLFKVAVTNPP